jgi:serine beta-lactamase-like protein LACTB
MLRWTFLGQGLALTVALLVSPVRAAGSGHAALGPGALHEIERAIASEMARWKIPGMSVAVGEQSGPVWAEGFGLADVENSVPARADTVYRIGSIAKPITAVAVLQLFERGKLDLDAPIQTYVPSFPKKPWPITARELLAHQSGIRHYRTMAEVNSTRHYTNLLDPLKAFANEPLLFEPGTRYSYSTYGYSLLGAAVEGASGMRFLDYIRANVLTPAQMKHTGADDVYRLVPHRAHGYRRTIDGAIQNCALADTSNKIPGGGLLSTAGDLIRFVSALERGELVKPATRDLMFTAQRTRDGSSTPYSLGWSVSDEGGRHMVGHAGSQQGVSAFLVILPAEDVSVAVLANLEQVNLEPLAAAIAVIALDDDRR